MIEKITLNDWVDFFQSSKALEINIDESFSENKKLILNSRVFVRRAFLAFEKLSKEESNSKTEVDYVLNWYEKLNSSISSLSEQLKDESRLSFLCEKIGLPSWKLNAVSKIIFGQIVDSKMISQAQAEHNEWKTIQYIASIFLNVKKYDDLYTNEESKKFISCGLLSLDKAIIIRFWWEKINLYINTNFTVFQDSGISSKDNENMEEYMKVWGWVNFLTNIAKTKIMDIPNSGMNSIDCVRATKAHEVLIFASSEKDHNVASYNDMKNAYNNK